MSHYISGCIKDLLLPFCTLVRHLPFYVFIKRVNDMMGDNTIRFVCIVLFNSFKADGQICGWCVISSCVIMCSYPQMVQQKLILYPLCAIPLLPSFLSIDVIMATNWYSHWVCWWFNSNPGQTVLHPTELINQISTNPWFSLQTSWHTVRGTSPSSLSHFVIRYTMVT